VDYAVVALPPHPRDGAKGLTHDEVKAYMVEVKRLFETANAVPVSDVGLISTQEDVVRKPMLNHVAAFANETVRAYLLVQTHSLGSEMVLLFHRAGFDARSRARLLRRVEAAVRSSRARVATNAIRQDRSRSIPRAKTCARRAARGGGERAHRRATALGFSIFPWILRSRPPAKN
jgi:hypothetical protein